MDKEIYTKQAWKENASRREVVFRFLGVSHPFWYEDKWYEEYNLLNPITYLTLLVSLVINIAISAGFAIYATLDLTLSKEQEVDYSKIKTYKEAPDC